MSHWYLQDGTAYHFREDGKPTTLRDARKVNALPSVTTVLNILDKPALTGWKLKRVTEACYTTQHEWGVCDADYDTYHRDILGLAFQDSTDARDRGSEIHDCLEAIIAGLPKKFPKDIQDIANQAFVKIVEYCETSRFIAEETVAGDGYGGMIDAHNDEFIIDWKTKDGIEQGGKYHYPEMIMQLAAYDKALPHVSVNRRALNVFIDRQTGETVIHEWKPEEVQAAWQKFVLLVQFWQLEKKYKPEGS